MKQFIDTTFHWHLDSKLDANIVFLATDLKSVVAVEILLSSMACKQSV